MDRQLDWRIILVLVNLIVLLDAQSYIGAGSSVPLLNDADDLCEAYRDDPRGTLFIADSRSLCWFFVCRNAGNNAIKVVPKRCSLGTYVSEGFKHNFYNPCTENFPILGFYDCTRKTIAPNVNCIGPLNCQNGGTSKQEGTKCWCSCPPDYQGEADCSKPTGTTPPPTSPGPTARSSAPTPQSTTPQCRRNVSACSGDTCKNGGTCSLDCAGSFSCQCPVPYTKTRFCEQFNCKDNGFKCPDARDTCTRGLYSSDEVYVCRRSDQCREYLRQWSYEITN